MTATTAKMVAVEKRLAAPEEPTLARLRIQPVAVVPMLAPMMMAMAWGSCMMPEFTKPTTITVVAEEDWITAVTKAPSSTPLSGVEVRRPRVVSSLPPATFFRESPMRDMPKRKKARPPSRVMMEARFIGVHPFRSRCSGLPPGWMSADTHY